MFKQTNQTLISNTPFSFHIEFSLARIIIIYIEKKQNRNLQGRKSNKPTKQLGTKIYKN
jgi:hypothetical protein